MGEGYVAVTGGRIWYKMIGDGSETPLVLLHGGPGFSSLGTDGWLGTLGDERRVIVYDQLGAGNSDRPNDVALWRADRFVEELGQLRRALDLDEIHLLGHSWGTMLAGSYMLTQPTGVRSVIFSSPCLSAPRWAKDQEAHLQQLPVDAQDAIARCEAAGTTDSEEYQAAMMLFYRRYVCRLDPWPSVLEQAFEAANMQVYNTMWGPSEFSATGNLKEFDVTSRLHEIRIPTLFLCGRYDEATPETTAYYQSLVRDAQYHVFDHSAHMTFLEEPGEYLRVVGDFLKAV
ncbi:MAG: proline iminopeptidase-family hydrolase [Bacilli bacterium]